MSTRPSKMARTGTLDIKQFEFIDIYKNLDQINSLNNKFSLKLLTFFKVLSLNLTEGQLNRLPIDLKNVMTMEDIDFKKAISTLGSKDENEKFNEMIDRTRKIANSCFFEFAMEKAGVAFNVLKKRKALSDSLKVLEKLPFYLRETFLNVRNSNKSGISGNPDYGSAFLQLALLEKEEKIAFKILELLDLKNRKKVLISKNAHGFNALDIAKDNEKLTKDLLSYLSEEDRDEILSRMEE